MRENPPIGDKRILFYLSHFVTIFNNLYPDRGGGGGGGGGEGFLLLLFFVSEKIDSDSGPLGENCFAISSALIIKGLDSPEMSDSIKSRGTST